MNKFNLTFSGEIIAGHDPAEVRSRFGKLYEIDDPARLNRFFSGETVILRRNMERKEAARCYHELHLLGAVAALVKVTTSDTVNALVSAQGSPQARSQTESQSTLKKTKRSSPSAAAQPAKQKSPPRNLAKPNRKPAARPATVNGNSVQHAPSDAVQHVFAPGQRDSVDIAASIKARKLAAQRAAAELAAQEQAIQAEQQRRVQEQQARRAEEAAAQRAAQEAEDRRRSDEEAARKAAELAAIRQREAEEAARRADEAAAIQQREAEEAARKAAEAAAVKQRKAEEAARKAAEEAAIKQRKAEEAARKAAEEAAIKQRKAEEAARIKAEKAEARRKAAAQEAQRQAQRKREKEDRARQQAAEEARRKAELEAQQRRAAEDARRKAEQAELERREAEEDARLRAELAAIKQREEEEAARLRAELEVKAHEAAAQAQRIKQQAQQLQAEAQRKSANRRRAAAQALAARQAQRNPIAQHGSSGAVPGSAPGLVNARIKSALEAPQRTPINSADTPGTTPRKRQPGEPNLYQLRPFRASEEVRSRAARAQRLRLRCYAVGTVALAVLLLVLGNYLQRTVEPAINGPRAAAVAPHQGPVLLAGDTLLFHDRAGNSTTAVTLGELQLAELEPPFAFDSAGVLYARGRLAGSEPDDTALQLLRCEPPITACREFSADLRQHNIDAFALNPVDGSVLLADAQAGVLMKAGRDGKLMARATLALPSQPILQLQGGLLLINSKDAPALSVLRYEDKAFGQQLDEILLLPPSATEAQTLRVSNFLWSGDAWWAVLRNRDSGAGKVYRFDDAWNYLNEVALPHLTGELQLTAWGTKTLVSDAQHLAMDRFNAQGIAEADFVSGTLDKLKTAQQRRLGLSSTAWHSSLLLCALIVVLGLGLGFLNTLRTLVYNARRESGAEPIDGYADRLCWIDPVADRAKSLRRSTVCYCLLVLGLLALAITLSVTASQLTALLIALSGPLLALLWLARKPIGAIGVVGERLALVDHNGMYHIAGGSRIQHCGPFLCIDDVLVLSGTRMLPAFSPVQLQQQVRPLALGGVKVDYRTVLVKLVQSRHPLVVGAFAMFAAAATALLVLSLQGMY